MLEQLIGPLIYDHSFWAAHYFHEIVSILSEQRVIAHLACVMSWLESVFVLLVWKETAVIGVNLRHMDMTRWLVVRYILHITVWEKEREIFEETLSSLALIKWEIDHLSTWLSMDKTPMICPTVLYVTGMQMQPSRSSRWKSQLWPDHRAVPVSTVVTCWNFRDDVYYTEVTFFNNGCRWAEWHISTHSSPSCTCANIFFLHMHTNIAEHPQ